MKYPFFIALLASSPVFADCPVAADLVGGVRVIEDDGTIVTFVAQGDGLVLQEIIFALDNGIIYRTMLAHGTSVVSSMDTQNGAVIDETQMDTSYPVAPADLPVPTPLSSHTFETTVVDSIGQYSATQTQSWGAMQSLAIGDCTYDMFLGKVNYTSDYYVVTEKLHYLPALELALLYSRKTDDQPEYFYTASYIETMQ